MTKSSHRRLLRMSDALTCAVPCRRLWWILIGCQCSCHPSNHSKEWSEQHHSRQWLSLWFWCECRDPLELEFLKQYLSSWLVFLYSDQSLTWMIKSDNCRAFCISFQDDGGCIASFCSESRIAFLFVCKEKQFQFAFLFANTNTRTEGFAMICDI